MKICYHASIIFVILHVTKYFEGFWWSKLPKMYTNAHTNHKSYNRFTCIPTTTKIHKHLYTTLLFVVVYVFDDAVEIMIMMLCAVRLVMVLFCAVGFVRLDL